MNCVFLQASTVGLRVSSKGSGTSKCWSEQIVVVSCSQLTGLKVEVHCAVGLLLPIGDWPVGLFMTSVQGNDR